MNVEQDATKLLYKINERNKALTSKYNLFIPPSIINYCILYAFLGYWYKGGDNIKIKDRIVTKQNDKTGYETVYGNQIVKYGVHDGNLKY